MKKKILSMLFCLSIGILSVGCSLGDSEEVNEIVMESYDDSESDTDIAADTDAETADGESVSVAQEVGGEDPFADSELVKSGSATPVTDDGVYTATLLSTGKNQAGNPDEDGAVLCIAYDTALTDNELLMTGVYGYSSAAGEEQTSNSDDGSYSFKIDSNTKFTMVGSQDSIPLSNFKSALASCADSELVLEITVEGGVATSVAICS